MELKVLRYNRNKDYTESLLAIDNKFECHSLEDEYRAEKRYGETRIPDGTYPITFKSIEGIDKRHSNKFGKDFRHGMLLVGDVPGFEDIIINVSSYDDSAGCLFVGTSSDAYKGFIGGSVTAYKRIYPKIAKALLNGEDVNITYETIWK